MPEYATGYSPTSQVLSTDIILIGRPPASGSPAGAASQYFGNPAATLDSGIRPVVEVAAGGTTLASATPLAGGGAISVITSMTTGGGVGLKSQPGTQRVLNRAGAEALVYPPSGGNIESIGANQPAGIVNGGTADYHSSDGVVFYVG